MAPIVGMKENLDNLAMLLVYHLGGHFMKILLILWDNVIGLMMIHSVRLVFILILELEPIHAMGARLMVLFTISIIIFVLMIPVEMSIVPTHTAPTQDNVLAISKLC
jgi:hypothetical protein